MTPILSFIVPVRNDADALKRCLGSILSNDFRGKPEIIVVDNGSSDSSAEVARRSGARVLVLPGERVSALRNAGARAASSDLLAFVDADHELEQGWGSAAASLFDDPAVGAAGAQYSAPPQGTWVQRVYDALRRRSPGRQPADWLPSGNLVVRRAAFESVAGFDTSLVTCEDVDFCQRLRSKDWRLLADDGLRSVHHGDPHTLGALFRGELWRGQDNLRVSFRRHGLRELPSALFPLTMLIACLVSGLGVVALPFGLRWPLMAGLALLAAVVTTRTGFLITRTPRSDRSVSRFFQTLVVGIVYDLARACALVVRQPHEVRQSGLDSGSSPPAGRIDFNVKRQTKYAAWVPWVVIACAGFLRLLYVGEWSLWEDEEASIFFALNPGRSFPRSFPLYFWMLGSLFDVTGVSVVAARILTALIGIATLWLVYTTAKRFCGDAVAVPALVLLSVSVGHLFWSQSLRYYVLVLGFQLLSVRALLAAIERPRVVTWGLSALWFLFALASHATAVLLLPVYGAYVGWLAVRRAQRRVLLIALLLLASLAGLSGWIWVDAFSEFAAAFSRSSPATAYYVIERTVQYAGMPAVALALVALALERRGGSGFLFFVLLAVVPVIELMVIGSRGLWYALWYHGLISLVGIAIVGGYGWKVLTERAPRWVVLNVGAAAAIFSVFLLVIYYTSAYGDRPRYREAVMAVKSHADAAGTGTVPVVALSPGVVAHYLGIPPERTMGNPAVTDWYQRGKVGAVPGYAIIVEHAVQPSDREWLRLSCDLVAELPSRMVTRDRTVVAFWCGNGF